MFSNFHMSSYGILQSSLQIVFVQDILQDETLKLDESFSNSFINELMLVRMSLRVCNIGYESTVVNLGASHQNKIFYTEQFY